MRIILSILLSSLTFALSAQLKTIDLPKGEPAASNIAIEIPDTKKKVVEQRVAGTWNPHAITYAKSQEENLRIETVSKDLPISISGRLSKSSEQRSTEESAMDYLVAASDLMYITNADEEWHLISNEHDHLGMDHLKYQQTYQGVPIYGSEVIVHGDTKGMKSLNGRYHATPVDISTTPAMIDKAALKIANDNLGKKTTLDQDRYGLFAAHKDESTLVLYPHEGNLILAYHVTTFENIVSRWEYFVDANTGAILSKHESICKFHNHDLSNITAEKNVESAPVPPVISNSVDLFGATQAINTFQSGSNFFMIDAVRTEMFDASNSSMPNEPVGTIWTIDAFDTSPQSSGFNYDHVASSSQSFPNKRTAVSAHLNGGKAYEYFLNVHDRVSINGQGGNIISLVNVADEDGGGLDNAFWNGVAMFYGNGRTGFKELARGLDVAGHEMTHGVVQSTANLQYVGESGALNESFADVFGAMIDRDDWLIGEDVVNASSFPSGALRSMIDPHNGAANGDFGGGFQPKKYSERFTGSQDNGGVHINSGIPNHAFYLFAENSAVGKNRAEKVFYRALTQYMTKSSQFEDARVATVKAAQDLYGDNVVAALRSAWDQVEVFGEDGGSYEEEVETNPGNDLIVFTSVGTSGTNDLFIANSDGSLVFNPATERNPKSQPSVTDDGSEILYVTDDGELGYLFIDWEMGMIESDIILSSPGGWRNAVFSKDGLRLAAIREVQEDSIFVFDFVSGSGAWYELYNPTFSQDGTTTGDVQFADALEFDFTGEFIMYDAFNTIESIFGNNIEYWDVGFVKVWNNAAETFSLDGQIEKLFAGLPEGISIGNPTFSKNSPFIIAFDQLENDEFSIRGANTETGAIGTIFAGNDRPGYPSFSLSDDRVIFDATSNGKEVIGGAILAENKIEGTGDAGVQLSYDLGVRWGVWFGNGDRVISDVEDELLAGIHVYPNPTSDIVTVDLGDNETGNFTIDVVDVMGRTLTSVSNNHVIDLSELPAGQYVLNLKSENGLFSTMITKR